MSIDAAPINFDESFSVNAHYDPTQTKLFVTVSLKGGVHAYGPQETIGKPVGLSILDHNGWQALGKAVIPEGSKKTLASLGASYVISGTFAVVQALKPGHGEGKARLYLQICTEQQCDRPRTIDLTFQ